MDAMLLAEIGCGTEESKRNKAQQMAGDPGVKQLADPIHAGPGRGKTVDNINGIAHGGGTSASYLVRRLELDAPDIARDPAEVAAPLT
jgi:hypothetical protein